MVRGWVEPIDFKFDVFIGIMHAIHEAQFTILNRTVFIALVVNSQLEFKLEATEEN